MSMNVTDWTLLTLLGLSAAIGLWRGLVYEVLSLAGWVAAFLLAQTYAASVGSRLPMDGFSAPLPLAAGFALVFIGVVFLAGLVAWVVKKLAASVGLRPVDRILGGAFGLMRGAVLLLALAVVVSMTPGQLQPWWRDSSVAATLVSTLHSLKPLLPASVALYLP